jgi:hypothetical protein
MEGRAAAGLAVVSPPKGGPPLSFARKKKGLDPEWNMTKKRRE